MIRTVWRILSSIRLTLFLILSLVCVFLLGLWIPQKSVLQRDLYLQWQAQAPAAVAVLDALELTSIYRSPITLTLWGLFFLNLSLVMGQRIPVVRSRIALRADRLDDPEAAAGFPQQMQVPLPPDRGIDQVAQAVEQAGYTVLRARDRFVAVKNRLSPVANLVFHFSFFLVLLGGVISVYTRFAGTVDLAEGEAFRGDLTQYHAYPHLPQVGAPPQAQFVVERIEPEVTEGTQTGLRITLSDSGGARQIVDINRPYRTDNTSFVIRSLGVAPLIVLSDRQRRELDGAYVKLNVLNGKPDGFTMAGLEFIATFYPDHIERYGVDGTQSEEIRNPAFLLEMRKDGRLLARRVFKVGETGPIGDYRLEIREMPYWVRFYVVKERGLAILYTGFAAATTALIWRLLFYRREIIGIVRQEDGSAVLHLAGRAEFYRVLFADELQDLADAIRSPSSGS